MNNELKEMLMSVFSNSLQPIRDELSAVKDEQNRTNQVLQLLKSQLDENTQLTQAIYHRQEETDSKLENLAFHTQKIHDELSSIKDDVHNIKGEIAFTYEKTSKNELEIFKLRKERAE